MAIFETDRRRALEANRDIDRSGDLVPIAPESLRPAIAAAAEAYGTARADLEAAHAAVIGDRLETDATREQVRIAERDSAAHYRYVRGHVFNIAINPPPGAAIDPQTRLRWERAANTLMPAQPSAYERFAPDRKLAALNTLITNLPEAGLPGVDGAAWWAGVQQSRDALDAAIAEWVRERGEDRDASRALDAARERFDRAQRVYEGLAEVTLAWAQRDAELPRFVYRKDPAYRAQLRTSPTDTEG